MSCQPREGFLGVVRRGRGPEEEGVVVRSGDEELGLRRTELVVARESEGLSVFVRGGDRARLVVRSSAEDEVGVECHRVDPVSVV